MNEFKKEWDNYPQEIYDKLKDLGWHIHIIDGEVALVVSKDEDYIYSYCKGAKPEVRIFGRSYENIFRVCDGDINKDTDSLMWNLRHSLDPHYCYHEGSYTLNEDGTCCKCHRLPNPKAK